MPCFGFSVVSNSFISDKKKGGAPPAGSSRNLWVSGLSSSTRATDLKQVFSKYGKVIGAKVVTNARTPGARCYGYVTMATSEDASKCIQYLHRTELHGRMISVERAKGDSTGPPRKSESKVPAKKVEEKKRHERKLSTTSGKGEDKKKEETEEKKEEKSETTEDVVIVDEVELKKETEEDEAGEEKTGEDSDKTEGNKTSPGEKLPTTRSREVSRDRKERERQRSVGSSHVSRPHSKSPHRIVKVAPRPGVLTFAQIRPQKRLRRRRGGRGRAKRAADFRAAKSISTVQENLVTGQDHPVVPSLHTNLDTDQPQPLSPSLQPNIYEASPAPPSLLANINEAPPVHYSLQANINTSLVSQFAQSFKPFTALPKLSGIMLPHTLQSNLLFQLLINDHLQTSMEERERQRVREREREMREEERRRREEISRQRDLERRNREEAMKLEREKEKLRLERERIERDRAELIRLERERQRLEREKLEREREELKRQQLRLEEARRTAKRPAEDRRETYPDDRKRVAGERRFEGSSRFEERSNIFETKKDLKRPTDFNHRGGKYDNAIFDTTHSSRRDRDNLVGRHADVPRREHAAPDPPRGKDLFSRGKERLDPLLMSSSSSFVLTRLELTQFQTHCFTKKSSSAGEINQDLWICNQEL
uniref:RRM domain-containing protein n=1 Tax=Timema cristinae TaxID=61476 RepID=A0A7R9CGL9_TIMCR|nr:unnamed protein product [Timema cristinae]